MSEIGLYDGRLSKFETNFYCSPEQYFWENGHPVVMSFIISLSS